MFTKRKPLGIAVCLLAVLASCSEIHDARFPGYEEAIDVKNITAIPNDPGKKTIDLHIPTPEKSFFDFQQQLQDIRFVQLEKTAQSVIGKIDKILFGDERIVIVDFKITESVFIFDASGKFINKIKAGKDRSDVSNGGMSHFLDATYYHNTNEIVLHDNKAGKTYYYDNKGIFKRADEEYISFFNFDNLKNTDQFVYLDLYTQNNHIPALTTSDIYLGKPGTKIQHVLPNAVQRVKINANYHYQSNLSSGDGSTIFYTPVFSDTIFAIEGPQPVIYPKFALHFPGPDLVTKIKEQPAEIDMPRLNSLRNSHQYYSFSGNILPVKDSVYFIECVKDGQLGYFYSEKTNNIIGGNIRARMAFGDSSRIDSYSFPLASYDREFVSIIKPDAAVHQPNTLKTAALARALQGIDRNSNPILAFYTLKSF